MRIAEKLARCANSDWEQSAVSIAFLGDSVTQGCFEMYCKENGNPETVLSRSMPITDMLRGYCLYYIPMCLSQSLTLAAAETIHSAVWKGWNGMFCRISRT